MKKILLTSSAMALMLPFSAQHASAEHLIRTPRLQISGEISPQFHGFNQKKRQENKGKGFGQHLAIEDSRISFDVQGKTDVLGGLEYGFLVGLGLDTGETNNIEEVRASFKNEYGDVMIGDTRGFDDFGSVGPWKVMGGTGGGIYGNMTSSYNPTSGVRFSSDIVGTSKDATKINYVSPRFSFSPLFPGVQFGFTYTPNSAHDGATKLFTNLNGAKVTQHFFPAQPFDQNQIAFGVNFKNTYQNGFNVQASLVGLHGHTKKGKRKDATGNSAYIPDATAAGNYLAIPNTKPRDTKGYAAGAVLGWHDWKVGVEYINNGKSSEPRALKGSDAGKVYSGAVGYTWTVNSVAAGYSRTERKLGTGFTKAKANVYTLTYDRKIAPGLEAFIEGNYADQKTDAKYVNFVKNVKAMNDFKTTNDAVGNNKYKGVLAGGRVRF